MNNLARTLLRVLERVLPASVSKGLVGDLEELFHDRKASLGTLRATLWLTGQVVGTSTRYGIRYVREVAEVWSTSKGSGSMGFGHAGKMFMRQIRKAPGFSGTVVLMVAVGVGVVATVFALVEGILLRPMPYPDAERIVSLSEDNPTISISAGWTSIPNFVDWKEDAASFEAMALFRGRSVSVGTDGDPAYGYGARVTHEFFRVFGIEPALGRAFTEEETRGVGETVVVLSHGLWAQGYGSDPEVLGRTVLIDGQAHTVVGVMPEGYNAPGEWIGPTLGVTVWRPFAIDATDPREDRSYSAVARLKAGTTLAAARDEMTTIHGRLRTAFPEANGEWLAQVVEWKVLIVGGLEGPLLLLLAAMGLVLVTACANVASLATTRVLARIRELNTRRALGASRGTIATQVVLGLAFLVGIGGLLGVVGTLLAIHGIKVMDTGIIPRLHEVHVSGLVLGFSLAVTAISALAVGGLACGLTLRGGAFDNLKRRDGGQSVAGWRIRSLLTTGQIAVSFVLLAGATLLASSFRNMVNTDLGFDPENTLAMTVALSWERVGDPAERAAFTRTLLEELGDIPGVEAAAMINSLPLTGSRQVSRVTIDGRTEPGREPAMAIRGVSPSYHQTLRIPLLDGRLLTESDLQSPNVALVSHGAADRHWATTSPIGERIQLGSSGGWLTVVGMVGNVRHGGASGEVLPEIYVPYPIESLTSKSFVVRSSEAPGVIAPAMRAALRRVDPDQPVREIRSLEEWARLVLAP
ncbi:MAG: ABC transporter permease, partial [Gemmatimonadota bacterium]|nr:ABC transporter permease [Gemmatimonadota bacterium]